MLNFLLPQVPFPQTQHTYIRTYYVLNAFIDIVLLYPPHNQSSTVMNITGSVTF